MDTRYANIIGVSILKQRNYLAVIVLLLLFANIISLTLLSRADTKTMIIPANAKKAFWVSDYNVSNDYLEEMSGLFVSLLNNLVPGNNTYNKDILMRHVAPESFATVKDLLEKKIAQVKSVNMSTDFRPSKIIVDEHKLSTVTQGTLYQYIDNIIAYKNLQTYQIDYDYKYGLLTIKAIKIIEDKRIEK